MREIDIQVAAIPCQMTKLIFNLVRLTKIQDHNIFN